MNRRIGLTALAVVLALIGAVAVYTYAHGADKRAAASLSPTPALIVQKAIPVGTSWQDVVRGGYATVENVPRSASPSSAIRGLNAGVPHDDVANFGISTGQILVREMFSKATPTTGALAIPDRMQALTVALTTDADVAGFVQHGSTVAIYATFKTDGGQNAGNRVTAGGTDIYATKLLLSKVSVLAVNQVAPTNVTGAHGSSSGTTTTQSSTDKVLVTLAVDQKAAERIVLAQQVGSLYLSLLTTTSNATEDGGTINFGHFRPEPIFTR